MTIPQRPLQYSDRLPATVSIVGLGCSSFSTFFWSRDEEEEAQSQQQQHAQAPTPPQAITATSTSTQSNSLFTPETLSKTHPRVQEWINAIRYAILQAGITLLDTAPWYGHGTSEIVIGWALEDLLLVEEQQQQQRQQQLSPKIQRKSIILNTKVGRYEADPAKQFDFSREMTLKSVQRSLERMKCQYIDVLQLHDPEFAPSLDQLLQETIPAMMECRDKGWCRALGMTGYPLEVQHFILERSMQVFGHNIWDQALTYCHYNLHDTTLVDQPLILRNGTKSHASFVDYCHGAMKMEVLAAAPLSMGLLTHRGPPEWHPASDELKQACRQAVDICQQHGVDISHLALLFALSNQQIPCTILGMKSVEEVKKIEGVTARIVEAADNDRTGTNASLRQEYLLQRVLKTEKERTAYRLIRDTSKGPFSKILQNGLQKWDGAQEAREFRKQLGKKDVPAWHNEVYEVTI